MSKKILIAEDENFLNKMYKLHFEEQDKKYEVETVINGEQAIASMDKGQPDLLLLDLLMPKVDGFAVLEHIKKKKYTFPVIILSNLSQDIDKNRCNELGATDYFIKSDMDLDELATHIEKYL